MLLESDLQHCLVVECSIFQMNALENNQQKYFVPHAHPLLHQ